MIHSSRRAGHYFLPIILGILVVAPNLPAQQPTPEEIINKFIARETETERAYKLYTHLEDMLLRGINSYNISSSQYRRSSTVSFPHGERRESFLEVKNDMKRVVVTDTDLYDLGHIYQFFLTERNRADYKLTFLRAEKVDELNTYVIEIKPASNPDAHSSKRTDRVFRGEIWVDDKDFQIVKMAGHSEPEDRINRSARFETYYTFVADKYWFPLQTISNDVMGNGRSNRLTLKIDYTAYKLTGKPD